MKLVDMHAHILPRLDDGAETLEEALELLEMLKEQGVTHVMATPHFYPHIQSAEDFLEGRHRAEMELKAATKGKELPKIHIGCELFYYDEMGKVGDISPFAMMDSNYLLLELSMSAIDEKVIKTVENLCEMGYIPIIAHIERYLGFRGIKNILKLIEQGRCLAQVNASSIVEGDKTRKIYKLIKKGYIYVIASDTHSIKHRPPLISEALDLIAKNCGEEHRENLIRNSYKLYCKISGEKYE